MALCLAASYLEGEKRASLLKEAETLTQRTGNIREKEITNLRKWSKNSSNPSLRQVGPATILKNIFSLGKLENAAAEVFYSMLAF